MPGAIWPEVEAGCGDEAVAVAGEWGAGTVGPVRMARLPMTAPYMRWTAASASEGVANSTKLCARAVTQCEKRSSALDHCSTAKCRRTRAIKRGQVPPSHASSPTGGVHAARRTRLCMREAHVRRPIAHVPAWSTHGPRLHDGREMAREEGCVCVRGGEKKRKRAGVSSHYVRHFLLPRRRARRRGVFLSVR